MKLKLAGFYAFNRSQKIEILSKEISVTKQDFTKRVTMQNALTYSSLGSNQAGLISISRLVASQPRNGSISIITSSPFPFLFAGETISASTGCFITTSKTKTPTRRRPPPRTRGRENFEGDTIEPMITKCMLRSGSMNGGGGEMVAASATSASEFSDSSSSISIDEFPSSAWTLGGAAASGAAGGASARKIGANRLIFTTNDATMMTLMEASDCDEFTG